MIVHYRSKWCILCKIMIFKGYKKIQTASMVNFLIISFFMKFKIHGLIKIDPLNNYKLTMSVPIHFDLRAEERLYRV